MDGRTTDTEFISSKEKKKKWEMFNPRRETVESCLYVHVVRNNYIRINLLYTVNTLFDHLCISSVKMATASGAIISFQPQT